MNGTHPVASVSKACERMRVRCELIDALNGGTLGMRQSVSYGEKNGDKIQSRWLPQEDGESVQSYTNRVGRSVLYGAYVDTRESILSRPFSKSVQVKEEVPDLIGGIEKNADLEGSSLTEFARAALRSALDRGGVFGLVEYPSVEVQNLGEVRRLDIRPYFVAINATNVIGTTWAKAPNGIERMTSIRWRETVEVSDEWGTQEVERIQRRTFVYADEAGKGPGLVEVWEQDGEAKDGYKLVESSTHSFIGLPLAVLRLREVARLEFRPVMEDLAWLNLAHFQSDSDQRNNLHFGRVAILFAAGFTEEELKNKLKIGPSSLVQSTNESARLEYVEHGGGALSAGREDLRDLEARMEVQGLDPLMERRVNDQTATGAGIDQANESSDIQTWLRLEESWLEQLYAIAAQWVGVELPAEFSVDIFSEFSIPYSDASGISNLLQMWQAGAITHKTFLQEVRRRSVVDASLDVEEEIEAVKQEGPALGDFGMGNNFDPLNLGAPTPTPRPDAAPPPPLPDAA